MDTEDRHLYDLPGIGANTEVQGTTTLSRAVCDRDSVSPRMQQKSPLIERVMCYRYTEEILDCLL